MLLVILCRKISPRRRGKVYILYFHLLFAAWELDGLIELDGSETATE